jgi:hypothetical protein
MFEIGSLRHGTAFWLHSDADSFGLAKRHESGQLHRAVLWIHRTLSRRRRGTISAF